MFQEVMWWLCSALLAYNFIKAWKSDPGYLKSDRETKIKVKPNKNICVFQVT